MSEYQYYDFKAIDHALTKTEMAALRAISTRAVISTTSFTNHYEWGDLKADPLKLLEKYFDAFVYVANWGTREFHLRLPQELVDFKQLKSILPGNAARARSAGQFVIVTFESEVESDDDWDDGTGWMGSLVSLRSDLLRGDLRCLYLGWLHCVQNDEFSGDALEPPVPAGLRALSAPLDSFIEFLGIGEDLVEVAASACAPLKEGPSRKELATWVRGLPANEKDDLLIDSLSESGERWRVELLQRFQRENTVATSLGAIERRTVKDLLTATRVRADERARQLSAKRAADAAHVFAPSLSVAATPSTAPASWMSDMECLHTISRSTLFKNSMSRQTRIRLNTVTVRIRSTLVPSVAPTSSTGPSSSSSATMR